MNLEQLDDLLKRSLPENRYKHSINVMHEAEKLAVIYNVDKKKAKIAALLHDCGREYSNKEVADVAKKMGIKVSDIEKKQPVLLHCKVGKIVAKEKYKITDKQILSAIESHTTGKANMTDFDMVIFLADLIEPLRVQKGVVSLRKLARKNLYQAMLKALKDTINHLLKNKLYIHPNCIECLNDIIAKHKVSE